MTSNDASNCTQLRAVLSPSPERIAPVHFTAAISNGMAIGTRSNGNRISRALVLAAIAAKLVPRADSPKLPRMATRASCGNWPTTRTLKKMMKIKNVAAIVVVTVSYTHLRAHET